MTISFSTRRKRRQVVKDLDRGRLLRQAHGLAGDPVVHGLVEFRQFLVEAADGAGQGPQDPRLQDRRPQRATGARFGLTDADDRLLHAGQGQQEAPAQAQGPQAETA